MMQLARHADTPPVHRHFYELPDLLQPGDLIVANNTKVLPARLFGHRQGYTGQIEVLLLHPDPAAPAESKDTQWLAMTRPTRKLEVGTIIELPGSDATVEIITLGQGVRTVVQIHLGATPSVAELMQQIGHMPIPPYLKRKDEEQDKTTYQTVYSKTPGSQAAPTAGLHFTPEIITQLQSRGIGFSELTLSVSSGTFRSVDVEDIRHHQMDPEHYTLEQPTVEAILKTKANGGRVVAVGTTTLKTLETVAAKFQGQLQADSDWSRLFIYPGFDFKIVDGLITNFHLPNTTLMMLVSAFAGREKILNAYQSAVQKQYRFFSYGDCMLIL